MPPSSPGLDRYAAGCALLSALAIVCMIALLCAWAFSL
jgi:hypothetical protein